VKVIVIPSLFDFWSKKIERESLDISAIDSRVPLSPRQFKQKKKKQKKKRGKEGTQINYGRPTFYLRN